MNRDGINQEPAIEYVVGFLFSPSRRHVLLVHKLRPAWLAGKWTGIGGKVEPGETAITAMNRECMEECGLTVNWKFFAKLGGEGFVIHCFRAFDYAILDSEQREDEPLVIHSTLDLPCSVIPNVRWLIPMALSFENGEIANDFQIEQHA